MGIRRARACELEPTFDQIIKAEGVEVRAGLGEGAFIYFCRVSCMRISVLETDTGCYYDPMMPRSQLTVEFTFYAIRDQVSLRVIDDCR